MWVKKHLEGALWLISFGGLILAAQTWAVGAYLAAIAGIFAASTVVVIPLHFYRAWRRLRTVPNKRAYAFWVGPRDFVRWCPHRCLCSWDTLAARLSAEGPSAPSAIAFVGDSGSDLEKSFAQGRSRE